MKKFSKIAGALTLALPVVSYAANTVQFDPDGSGPLGAKTITVLDWGVGNALSIGGAGVQTGQTTQLLYQANLDTAKNGNVIQSVNGFGGASFVTAVAGFQEVATVSNGGQTVNFTLGGSAITAPSATNFFYIYANNGGVAADDLAGTGFTNGKIIMAGYVSSLASSNFNASATAPVLFDQVGVDDYSGKQTIVGSGATDITVKITSADASYFPGLSINNLTFSFFNNSQVTPFKQIDPSKQFDSDGLAGGSPFVPVLGTVNGFAGNGTGGRDFQFQADANQSFSVTAVPEPASLALVGVALAGLGFASRRRAAK